MAQFENREMQQRHDESHGEPKMKAEEHEAEGEQMKDVVDEHGPAKKMVIHSHHEDGHVHKSVHHDHESASKHVDEAFGEEPEEAEPFAGKETPEEEAAEGHMRIPTMG